MTAAPDTSTDPKRLENQFAREVVTYGWFATIAISLLVTILWIVDVGLVPDDVGLFVAGWTGATVFSIVTLIVGRLLRPSTVKHESSS